MNMHLNYLTNQWKTYKTSPKISKQLTRHKLKVSIFVELPNKTMKIINNLLKIENHTKTKLTFLNKWNPKPENQMNIEK